MKSLTLINEKCLDLQKQKKESKNYTCDEIVSLIFLLINALLEKTTTGKRQKTACGCSFLQQDRVECLSNDILVCIQSNKIFRSAVNGMN